MMCKLKVLHFKTYMAGTCSLQSSQCILFHSLEVFVWVFRCEFGSPQQTSDFFLCKSSDRLPRASKFKQLTWRTLRSPAANNCTDLRKSASRSEYCLNESFCTVVTVADLTALCPPSRTTSIVKEGQYIEIVDSFGCSVYIGYG